MTRIRADFNSVDQQGRVRSNSSRATAPIGPGDQVLVYDTEGHECEASVSTVDEETGAIALKLDISTWREPNSIEGSRTT